MTKTEDFASWVAPVRGVGRPRLYGERIAILCKLPSELIERLELTRVRRGFKTRNETVVALLEEGAEK